MARGKRSPLLLLYNIKTIIIVKLILYACTHAGARHIVHHHLMTAYHIAREKVLLVECFMVKAYQMNLWLNLYGQSMITILIGSYVLLVRSLNSSLVAMHKLFSYSHSYSYELSLLTIDSCIRGYLEYSATYIETSLGRRRTKFAF